MDFGELEAVDGVRLSWNIWPNSAAEAKRCIVPFGAMYSPTKSVHGLQKMPYDPLRCKGEKLKREIPKLLRMISDFLIKSNANSVIPVFLSYACHPLQVMFPLFN